MAENPSSSLPNQTRHTANFLRIGFILRAAAARSSAKNPDFP